MVRVIGLAAAAVLCWACPAAQADVLGVELPTATVQAATAPVTSTVTPVVEQVEHALPAVSAPADDTLRTATQVAKPAAQAAGTITTARVAQGRAGDSGARGASSLRRVPSARLRHLAPAHKPAAPHSRHATPQPAAPPRAASPAAGAPHPSGARHASHGDRHPAPPPSAPPHASGADGGISAGSAFAGGLAVLAAALTLMAPRLRRRITIHPAALRPMAFVALPERPG